MVVQTRPTCSLGAGEDARTDGWAPEDPHLLYRCPPSLVPLGSTSAQERGVLWCCVSPRSPSQELVDVTRDPCSRDTVSGPNTFRSVVMAQWQIALMKARARIT